VILLASPLARGESYLSTTRALAKRFRVHLFEMPGSGAGSQVGEPWRVFDYAAWVAPFAATCCPAGGVLVGHSYSGMVALALAAQKPTWLRALVVADTAGMGEPRTLRHGIGGAFVDAALDLHLVLRAWPHVAGNLVNHFSNCSSLVQQCLEADVVPLARHVTVPTLVAWSGRSRLMHATAAHRLASSIPNSQVVIASRGAHTWVVSQPEVFAEATAQFVGSLE
jgi:pimeloyl-ACP methyl ester carboxylesterase